MTLHISLLDRNLFLNDHAMTIPITILGPSLRNFHTVTSSNRSTTTTTSSSIPLTNHILTLIPA
ncbi:hypothetical protein M405DRAFT_834123 [Rhizopogon salebrosus TDB-379]|nr:hypothetical protein M405DRAFT_834123 [Rhizopogon salebrosus TDB-379]